MLFTCKQFYRKILALLEQWTALVGRMLLVLEGNVTVLSSRVKQSKKNAVTGRWLKI